MQTKIGLIGAGHIGQTLARHLSKAGYQVLISNSRDPKSLQGIVAGLGENITATSFQEATEPGVIIVSVPWSKIPEVAAKKENWQQKIIIDTSNNILAISPKLILDDTDGKATGTVVAGLFKGGEVVKAFNTLFFKVLEQDPVSGFGARALPISGDNEVAKATVKAIVEKIGFKALDLGGMAEGGKLQDIGGPLSSIDLVVASDRPAKAIDIVRTNTEEVQGKGDFELFEHLFADDFVDHTPQPGFRNDKRAVKALYGAIRSAIPDFTPRIQWMYSDGDRVTTYKTYEGTHTGGELFGIPATHKRVHFQTVDVMRVRDGQITDHWGIANLIDLIAQLNGTAAQ